MTMVVEHPAGLRIHLADQVECRRSGTGALHLRGPVMRRRAVSRFLGWLLRAPDRCEVELDDIGAFVVARCDGRPLGSIADDLAAHLRLTRREAEVCLGDFVHALLKRQLVRCDADQPT